MSHVVLLADPGQQRKPGEQPAITGFVSPAAKYSAASAEQLRGAPSPTAATSTTLSTTGPRISSCQLPQARTAGTEQFSGLQHRVQTRLPDVQLRGKIPKLFSSTKQL